MPSRKLASREAGPLGPACGSGQIFDTRTLSLVAEMETSACPPGAAARRVHLPGKTRYASARAEIVLDPRGLDGWLVPMISDVAGLTTWGKQDFPLIDDADVAQVKLEDPYCSQADSGRIFWDLPSPRAYIRGAVYTRDNELVAASQRRGGIASDVVLTVNPLRLTREERELASGQMVQGDWLYVGNWMHVFGHFLVETLPALWPAFEPGGEHFDGVCAHRFNVRERFAWQDELIRLAVGDLAIRIIDETPMRFQSLAVGRRLYDYPQRISSRANRVWDAVANSTGVENEARDRVFLSRSSMAARGQDPRSMTNAPAVDNVFAEHGFEVIHPEEIPIRKQVAIARDARILAGAAGSALHLAAFSRAARVVELGDARTQRSIVPTQRAIASVKNQEVAHIQYRSDGKGGLDIGHLEDCLNALGLT